MYCVACPLLFFHMTNSIFKVYIHGGGLAGGRSSGETPYYLMDYPDSEKIVFVAMNYRLGSLGFLTLKSDTGEYLSGNQGFRDQAMALQWVQDNIGQFGGNKDQVV